MIGLLIFLSLPIIPSLISLVSSSTLVLGISSIITNTALTLAFLSLIIEDWNICPLFKSIKLDLLSGYGLAIVISVSLLMSIYALGYFKQQEKNDDFRNEGVKKFYFMSGLLLSIMIFTCISGDIGWSWIAIEVTTLLFAMLLGIFRKSLSLESAWNYLIICSVGLILALMGIVILLVSYSGISGEEISLKLSSFSSNLGNFDPLLVKVAFIFLLIGLGTKMALAPMHAWLPDAIEKAEIPLAVFLTCALEQVVFIFFTRLKFIVDQALGNSDFTSSLLIFFGMFSVILVSIFIINQYDLRRMLGNASIQSIGIACIALGLSTQSALVAGLSYLFFQSLIKSALFFLIGNVLLVYGSTKIKDIGFIIKRLPTTAIFLLIALLGVNAFPPFAVFNAKFTILKELIHYSIPITIVFLLTTTLIFASFVYSFCKVIFFEAEDGQKQQVSPINYKSNIMLYTKIPIALGLGLSILGTFIVDKIKF